MKRTLLLLASLVLVAVAADLAEARTWSDASGKYKVDADLIAFSPTKVVLEQTDDKQLISLQMDELSQADQDYLKTKEAADTTNTPGFYGLTILTGGTPVDGYVRVTESGHITTYAYPAQPITRDTLDNISMVTPAEFSLLAAAAGITPQAGKGFIGVLVKDCTGSAITGATVSTTPAATVLYNVAGVPSSSATATAGDGIAYVANVTAGDVTVKASASGHTLRQHVVNARGDVITLTEIRP